MSENEFIKSSFVKLIQVDEEQKRYLMDATGIQTDRLDALIRGAEPSGMELIAICEVLGYLKHHHEEWAIPYTHEMHESDVVRAWVKRCFRETGRKNSYLRCLLEISGCESVEAVLQKYHIFMDGSILCTKQMPAFLDRLLPDLERVEGSHKISIPVSVVQSMEELAKIPFMEIPAGVESIARLQKADQLVVRGDEQDRTTLSTFISAFSKFKPSHSLVLLTCDPMLANAVNMLNAIGIEGEDVVVLKLRKNGTAAPWDEPETDEEAPEAALHPEEAAASNGDSEWIPFDDMDSDTFHEEPAEVIVADEPIVSEEAEEIIVEDEAITEEEEIIVEDEPTAEEEEIIVEDEPTAEEEEIIFGDEPIAEEEITGEDDTIIFGETEEIISEDTTMCAGDLDWEKILEQMGQADTADAEPAEALIDIENTFRGEGFGELLQLNLQANAAEVQGDEMEVDPDVEEMKNLLQLDDEQVEDGSMGDDALRQFIDVSSMLKIADDDGEEEDQLQDSYDEDDDGLYDELYAYDDGGDKLEQMIREALKQSMSTGEKAPLDMIPGGDDLPEL